LTRQSANIHVMIRAAKHAARALVRDFGEVEQLQVSQKGPADFVSIADTKAERTLYEDLSHARPGYGFLMEEGGAKPGTDPSHRWLVDPLDGTANFLHGIPHFCISIGLQRDDEIIAGVIYDPIKDETFWAEKGLGAFINDRRLRVAARRRLNEAVIATGIPFLGRDGHRPYLAEMEAVMAEVAGIRRFGAAALDLAYVAAGRFDGFWESGLHPWDIGAGIIVVREAGGFVTDRHGGDSMLTNGTIVAANTDLHKPLLDLLGEAHPERRPSVA
jgi:myo-inositol-1(or 4)-monophosphatase